MRQRKRQLVPSGRAANVETACDPPGSMWLADPPQLSPVTRYTMFSAPGSGPWGGPRSCLLCSWASCSTGMLQSGHTFRTSSHLIRHLERQRRRGEVRPVHSGSETPWVLQ